MNTGLLPTKGLTLPFFSYGGSSLIICCVMVALVYRVSIELGIKPIKESSKKTSKKTNMRTMTAKKAAVNKKAANSIADDTLSSDEADEYVTGFDAYVEELSGGRDDK